MIIAALIDEGSIEKYKVTPADQQAKNFTACKTTGVRRLLELVNGQQLYSLGELDTLLRANKLDISQALPIWEREGVKWHAVLCSACGIRTAFYDKPGVAVAAWNRKAK